MKRFIFSFAIIAAGLLAGYIFQILYTKKTAKPLASLLTLRKTIQKIALLGLNPVAFLGAIWVLPINDLKIFILPFIGAAAIVFAGAAGLLAGKLFKLKPEKQGALFTSCAMSNIGSIGALLVFMIVGEQGFALVPFYKLFEELLYYSTGFPLARSFSAHKNPQKTSTLKRVITDPFIIAAVGSIGVGFILNVAGVARPAFYSRLNSMLIPVASFLLLFSIGLAMKFGKIKSHIPTSLIAVSVKFLFTPVFALMLGLLTGLGTVYDGLPLKVILLLSSMPVGFIALVPPTLYDLDVDLANSAWFITTASLVVVLPILSFILKLL